MKREGRWFLGKVKGHWRARNLQCPPLGNFGNKGSCVAGYWVLRSSGGFPDPRGGYNWNLEWGGGVSGSVSPHTGWSPQPWTPVARGRSHLLSPCVQAGPPTALHGKEFSRVWPVYHRNRKDNFDWYMDE